MTFQNLRLPGATIGYDANFLTPDIADQFQHELRTDLPWAQRQVMVQGRRYDQPRLTSWHGDAGAYTYSGLTLKANPWTPPLVRLRELVHQALAATKLDQVRFNSVLANLYRAGRRDSIGYHSDDEPELGNNPIIASVSLGARRNFQMVPKPGREGKRCALPLDHGSLLIMLGETQNNWKHGIDKVPNPSTADRINLTFRVIMP